MPMSFPEDVNLSAQEISKLYDELSNNPNIPIEELSPRYRMLLKAINDSKLDANFKLLIKRVLKDSDLGKRFKEMTTGFYDKMADEGDEMVPPSEPTDPADYDFGTRTSVYNEGLSKINNIKITKENKKMRITKQTLKKMIKEELKQVLKENMGYEDMTPGSFITIRVSNDGYETSIDSIKDPNSIEDDGSEGFNRPYFLASAQIVKVAINRDTDQPDEDE